jgi:predicted 3-demethylubiquinone-9 3-methyltransferase (glyoxalase superfamily)
MHSIGQCLWFDGQAQEAAEFYVSVFEGSSKVIRTATYLEGSPSPFPAGSVLTVQFELDGVEFIALNGGPNYAFTPAISIVVTCDTQDEIDRFWSGLTDGGQEVQCGWLVDRFGVSWQVAPKVLDEMIASDDRAAAQRAFTAMLPMKKLDVAVLQRAFDGA